MRTLLLATLAVLAARPATGQPRLGDADALVGPYHDLAMFDGVVLLARGDTVVHHAAYGPAIVGWDVPLTPDARFRVASVSKAFTAVAIGTLYERGLLTPETTLDAFAPSIPEADRITIRHLVGHRSGVAHLNDLDGYDVVMRGAVSLDSLVAWLSNQPLDFEPGTDYTYSNGGYALLALVIEAVSGQTYGDYLAEHVAGPLGLTATEHETLGAPVRRLARGYLPGLRPGERARAEYVAPDVKVGGGSLVSSAPDLLRFVRSLDGDGVVARATADSLLGASPVRYLSGRAPGYNAVVMRDREADLTAVVLSNSYAVTANSLAPALLAALRGGALAAALEPASGTTDWAGAYAWPPPFENDFEVRRLGGGWVYDEGADGDATAAVPLADDALLLPLYDARCTRPEAGGDLVCTAPWTGQALTLARR